MPIGVMSFSTASSPLVEEHREDPVGLEGRLRAILRGAGARLESRLYFEVGRERALALVKDLDVADPEQRKAILTTFGATYRKLITPEEAARARELEREFPNVEPEPEPDGGAQAA
jgi:hypothetical protein